MVTALTSYSENHPQGLQIDSDRGNGAPHLETFGHRLLPGAFPESFGVTGAQGSSSGLHFHLTEMCGARHTAYHPTEMCGTRHTAQLSEHSSLSR